MKNKHKRLATVILLSVSAVSAAAPLQTPYPLTHSTVNEQTINQWRKDKFGMFIHFGIYSELGGVWKGERSKHYSEQIFANANISKEEYAKIASQFNPTKFDAKEIVSLAKKSGMKYIVITTKHHDGFSLFDTKESDFNIVKFTPYKKDIIRDIANECKSQGLEFGVYYSNIDWYDPRGVDPIPSNSNDISDSLAQLNVAQIKELMRNYGEIKEIWFDMGKPTREQSQLFVKTVHDLQPQTMISGRVFNHAGDFTVMDDNKIPDFIIDEPWQTAASIYPETWGYRSWQKRNSEPEKTHEIIGQLIKVVSHGGNYILNIGPKGDGSVIDFEKTVLRDIGKWMEVNGESIYDTKPFSVNYVEGAFITQSADQKKLFVFAKKTHGIIIDGIDIPRSTTPYFLDKNNSAEITVSKQDSATEINLNKFHTRYEKEDSRGNYPVIVIPLEKVTHSKNHILIQKSKRSTFYTNSADIHYNFNGSGYEDPKTTYKYSWPVEITKGNYTLTLQQDSNASPQELCVWLENKCHLIDKNQTSIPIEINKNVLTHLEITPSAPFNKGDKINAQISKVTIE